jgi:ADP-heptose:LPS heptosyltransferase
MPIRPARSVQRDAAFFRMAGVRRIVGLPSHSDNRRRPDPATGLYESEAMRLARGIAELGDAHPEQIASWDLRLTDAEREKARLVLEPVASRPLIVCAPGCKMQANDWEGENWRALLGRLYRRYPEHALVMSGATEEIAVCEFAASEWAGPKLMLAGVLTPRESAAVFAQAAVFLGPDSGPKHLAASVGARCVCVFGARDLPGVWFPPGDWFAPGKGHQVIYHQPECFGCELETCIENRKKCIRSVTVEEVEHAVVRVLG